MNRTNSLPTEDQLITKKEAAERIGVTLITINRHLTRGRLTKYVLGNGFHVRVDVREVDQLTVWRPTSGPVAHAS